MKMYKIYYEVDNGCAYIMDHALVLALDDKDAVEKLSEFISAKDNDTYVSGIVDVKEFKDEIFTGKFGYK